MTCAVKYCGGCNPRYDRAAVVSELKARFPALNFVPAGQAESQDIVLVVCGCAARCANRRGLTGKRGNFMLAAREELPGLCEKLNTAINKE